MAERNGSGIENELGTNLYNWAFREWQSNAVDQKEEREENQIADGHFIRKLLGKVIAAWKDYASMHAYKRYRNDGEIENAREVLDKLKIRRCFSRWKEAKDEAVLQRLKYQQAVFHHERLVQRKLLFAWKEFTMLCLKKQLMRRQAEWFHDTTLTAKTYVRWKASHQRKRLENDKTFLALYQWSLNLQRKVLVSWFNYTLDRKRKKERYAAAMERRRRRLLTDGLRQWLTVSADMQEMRLKWAANRQAKTAYDLLHVVRKCALHWRAKTVKQKAARGGAPLVRKPVPKPAQSVVSPEQSEEWRKHPQRIAMEPEFSQATRPRPRRPDFLIESLKREGLYTPDKEQQKRELVPSYRMDTADLYHVSTKEDGPPLPRTPSRPVPQEPKYQSPIRQEKVKITIPPSPVIRQEEQRSRSLPCTPTRSRQGQRSTLMTPDYFSPKKSFGGLQLKHRRDLSPAGQGALVDKPFGVDEDVIMDNEETCSPAKKLRAAILSPEKAGLGMEMCQEKVELLPPAAFMVSKEAKPPFTVAPFSAMQPKKSIVVEKSGEKSGGVDGNFEDSGGDAENGSPSDQEEELVEIRNTLQRFQNHKQRLSLLRTQYAQLSDWLKTQSLDEVEDQDSQQVIEELDQMSEEIDHLTRVIDEGRPLCQRLVKRANVLISCLDS